MQDQLTHDDWEREADERDERLARLLERLCAHEVRLRATESPRGGLTLIRGGKADES